MTELTGNDFASQSGHWYRKTGEPAYSIIGANGKERATTLRDARQHALVPSVTTILSMEAKPQLERWKIEQACLACMTLPRLPGEDDTAFMRRALEDSKEQAKKAAVRGTYLHGLIEESIRNGRIPFKATAADEAIINPVLTWLGTNFAGFLRDPERSFATDRYGGKIDLHLLADDQSVVIDFKTKKGVGPDTKGWPEQCTQLAAYANGIGYPDSRCINLFIDTDAPGVMVPVEWASDDVKVGWRAFGHLLDLWYCRKGL